MKDKHLRLLILVSSLLIIALIIASWVLGMGDEKNQVPLAVAYDYHFAINVGPTDTAFAKDFIAGAYNAAEGERIALEIYDYNSAYTEGGVDFISWAEYCRADAVITIPTGADEYDFVDDSKCDIFCVNVMSDMEWENSIYVGPDNYQEGWDLAYTVAEREKDEVNVGIITLPTPADTKRTMLAGFQDAAKSIGDKINIIAIETVDKSIVLAMSRAEELVRGYDEELDYLVCFTEELTIGTARGVIDLNKVNKIGIVGVGASDEIHTYIRNGVVDAAIDENAYEMGKTAVKTALGMVTGETSKKGRELRLISHKMVSN